MKFIFIVGSGHSGSTILDKAIGVHPQAFSLGEMSKFSAIVDKKGLCSCGHKITECEIWGYQIRQITNKEPIAIGEFKSLFPTKTAALKSQIFLNAAEFILQLFGAKFFLNNDNKKCIKNSLKILKRVHSLGFTHFIDSSKSLRRAVMIAHMVGSQNCLFIHLIRDGRAVMNSYSKETYYLKDQITGIKKAYSREPSDPQKIFRNWKYVNVFIHFYLKIKYNKQSITVRYEDFCTNPDKELAKIWGKAGLDIFKTKNYLNYTAHIIGGNSSRFNAKEIYPPSYSWKQNLPAKYKQLFSRKAKYAMKLFGYE